MSRHAHKSHLEAKRRNHKTYAGGRCSTCGGHTRFTSTRACVHCCNRSNYEKSKRAGLVGWQEKIERKRSNQPARELYGDGFDAEMAEEEMAFYTQFVTAPPQHRIYLSLVECEHGHPKLRDKRTGDCMTCRYERAQSLWEERSNQSARVVLQAKAYWKAVGSPSRWQTGLPGHLRYGVRCSRDHVGVRYRSTGACWFCVKEQDRKHPRWKSQADVALVIAALVA